MTESQKTTRPVRTLAELEASVRVPPDKQVIEQPAEDHPEARAWDQDAQTLRMAGGAAL